MKVHSSQKAIPRTRRSGDVLPTALGGLAVGFAAGAVVSLFRLFGEHCYIWMRLWTSSDVISAWLPIFGIAFISALIVGRLVRLPGISFGGESWIRWAIADGQPHPWRLILVPKFFGSFLVKMCGVSVGMEGPSIQLGCATALGMGHFPQTQALKRRHFALGGCAAGLAAAFSAPLCGVAYVFEMMHEPADKRLLLFLLSGSLGVYLSCNQLFGLETALPLIAVMPDILGVLLLLPLALGAGLVGLAYAWLLPLAAKIYARQKLIPACWLPMLAFMGAAIMLFLCPDITGEGPDSIPGLGARGLGFLLFYIAAKLVFTAFCYGTAIPCGVMVPLLTIGCVCGASFSVAMQTCGLLGSQYAGACMAAGMGAAFGAAERAPITAFFLVAGMTGAWDASMAILASAGIGSYLARLVGSKPV